MSVHQGLFQVVHRSPKGRSFAIERVDGTRMTLTHHHVAALGVDLGGYVWVESSERGTDLSPATADTTEQPAGEPVMYCRVARALRAVDVFGPAFGHSAFGR